MRVSSCSDLARPSETNRCHRMSITTSTAIHIRMKSTIIPSLSANTEPNFRLQQPE
jgi:hypothetical protein